MDETDKDDFYNEWIVLWGAMLAFHHNDEFDLAGDALPYIKITRIGNIQISQFIEDF
ncbi:MAG: hypothetical protein MRK01_13690 [Candidatus Scalindua sp.]|nr:hypothetical protein [Candidatus Scalindua sp.]